MIPQAYYRSLFIRKNMPLHQWNRDCLYWRRFRADVSFQIDRIQRQPPRPRREMLLWKDAAEAASIRLQ